MGLDLKEKPCVLASVEETLELGQSLAEQLHGGDVLALIGDLGAGKTHLAKGIVEGLGSAAEVSSPTFGLVHEYLDGRLPVFHFDFYRLEKALDVLALGWEEYLDQNGVLLVEWADRFPALIPSDARWLKLSHLPDGGRLLQEIGGAAELDKAR